MARKCFSQNAYKQVILSICKRRPKTKPTATRKRLNDATMDKLSRKR